MLVLSFSEVGVDCFRGRSMLTNVDTFFSKESSRRMGSWLPPVAAAAAAVGVFASYNWLRKNGMIDGILVDVVVYC